MAGLSDILPDADALIALSAEDLGMILLDLMQRSNALGFTPNEFEQPIWNAHLPTFPQQKRMAINGTLAEAWQWLQNEGLMMIDPDQPNGWFRLTRKGAALNSPTDINAYRHGKILPEAVMHPQLVAKVRPMYLRGDYDVAVVQAFKQVEVFVRHAAKLPDGATGQKLMREAFHPERGPLSDRGAAPGERQALMELFSGAFGHARNPPSHRDVAVSREEAAQLIGLASYLLSVAEWLYTLS